MPLFRCDKCGVIENTALGKFWGEKEKLCSQCGFGKWHGKFKRTKKIPKGEVLMNNNYNIYEKNKGKRIEADK